MAARLNPRHQQQVREKIRASQLITRLTNHALGKLKTGMDASQVMAARAVLDKVLPNAPQSLWHSGPDDEPIKQETTLVPSAPVPEVSPEEWLKLHGVNLQEIADGLGPAARATNQRPARRVG